MKTYSYKDIASVALCDTGISFILGWTASWETCMQVKKQQSELDMKQQTGSKLGKEYVKAVYCHSAYLTSMQSTSCEMLGWMKYKLESRLHLFNRREFEEALGVGDEQGILPYCSPCGRKELDKIEQLNWTEQKAGYIVPFVFM